MRSTPKLKFHYDTLTKDGLKLERMIIEARSKDQENNTDHNG